MDTYIAEYGNTRFFIQSFMLKDCMEKGCKIYKQIEVEVTDIDAELESIKQQGLAVNLEGLNEQSN